VLKRGNKKINSRYFKIKHQMKDNEKISIKTIVKYLRDFSIVVAGIAVTLYVNDRITNQGEKRDMVLYLNAIKMEMEENIKIIDEAIEFVQPSVRYSNYLQTHNVESLNKDTIKSYLPVYYSSRSFTFKTNAFEMFKSSGVMRLMEEKELLINIWDIYAELTDLKELIDWCDQIKTTDLIKEASSAIVVEGGKPLLHTENAPMYSYYVVGIPQNMKNGCEEVLPKLKALVEKL
jgi:hypothetical protein